MHLADLRGSVCSSDHKAGNHRGMPPVVRIKPLHASLVLQVAAKSNHSLPQFRTPEHQKVQ